MRRTRHRIAVAACLAALVTAVVPAAAQAAPRQLPPVGAVFTLALEAAGTELTVDGTTTKTDLSGDVVVRIVAGEEDPASVVHVRVLDLALTGQGPAGTVEIALDELDREALGTMTLTGATPTSVEHVLSLGFQVTLTPPGRRAEPVVLTTEQPARLTSEIAGFPPVNQPYALQGPVALVGADGTAAGTVDSFPISLTAV